MSNEDYSKVIEKIKKLFSLSKSSNENEAALALEKAREMMLKYNIEQNDLVKDQIDDIIELDFAIASRFNTPHMILAHWIGEGFMIKSIVIRTRTGHHKIDNKIKFVGSKTDVAVASYVYSYMVNIMETKSKEYFESIRYSKEKWSPLGAKKVKGDYEYGFVTAVVEKLKAMKAERIVKNPYEEEVCKSLVVVKNALVEKYIQDNIGKTTTLNRTTSYDKNNFTNGYSEGQKHGIHKGVGSSNSRKELK